MTVLLSSEKPFAQGGNRLCYVDPDDRGRCIKVRRPDFTLEDRRRKKGFPKSLLPLSHFDDNLDEFRVMNQLDTGFGEALYQHVSRCYGFVATDMGPGLASELIRDENGAVSQTLKKVLWDEGMSDECRKAVDALAAFWRSMGVPSRDLLLHNIVVERTAGDHIGRLVVIDGLGSAGLIPVHWLPLSIQAYKAEKKVKNLYQRIEVLLKQRGRTEFPGYHGLLLHDDRPES